MEIRMDVYSAEEFMVVGAMFTALGQLKHQGRLNSPEDQAECSTGETYTGSGHTTPVTDETAPVRVRARRKPVATATVAETTPVAQQIEGYVDRQPVLAPAPVVTEAPKPTAPPVAAAPVPTYTKADLENKTRALAKVNFTAAKALLDKFGVKRFGELPTEKYEEYGKAISAL